MRKARPNLAAALVVINVVASILSYTTTTPNALDYVVMVTGPIGAISSAHYMHKDGTPAWFKELSFWVLVLVGLSVLGYILPEV